MTSERAFRLTFEGVQQHLLADVLIHLCLRGEAGVIGLQGHKHMALLSLILGYNIDVFCVSVCV